MKRYQAIIIFVPNVTEEAIDNTIERLQKIANITRVDKHGVKKMVYTAIQKSTKIKFKSGYYVFCNMPSDDEQLKKIEKELDNDTNIVKCEIVRTE